MPENIHWLGHASIKICGSKTIYIDPWKLKKTASADIVLVTHDHYDHCSLDDIKKVSGKNTIVIAPKDAAGRVNAKAIKPGDKISISGVKITAVPAYNTNKQFHPKGNNWVGYLIEMDGRIIYIPGDTDVIPEMDDFKPDIAFFPVGGTYTMNAEEAAVIANKMNPKIAIPIHFGDIVGERKDAERFKDLCRCRVEILNAE